jgi:hypothetical protein
VACQTAQLYHAHIAWISEAGTKADFAFLDRFCILGTYIDSVLTSVCVSHRCLLKCQEHERCNAVTLNVPKKRCELKWVPDAYTATAAAHHKSYVVCNLCGGKHQHCCGAGECSSSALICVADVCTSCGKESQPICTGATASLQPHQCLLPCALLNLCAMCVPLQHACSPCTSTCAANLSTNT